MSSSGVAPGTSTLPGVVRIQDATGTNEAAVSATGALSTLAGGDTATNADGVAVTATASRSQGLALGYLFDGTAYDRHRSVSGLGDGLGVAQSMQPSSTYGAASATNATATVTFAAVAGQTHRLTSASVAYAATPTGATAATITDAGGTKFSWLGSTNPTGPQLPPGGLASSAVNQAMTVTLGAGGIGITGWVMATKLTA